MLLAGVNCARTRPAPLAPDPSLVGQQFVGHLPGTTALAARLLSTPGDVEYAIHHLDTPAGERLIVTSLVGRNSAGVPRYEVRAALVPPARRRSELLVVSACALNGVLDVDLVAVARRASQPTLTRIVRAWRASGPAATLEPVPTDGITCEHEGWHAR
jgi:hypothetical protein